MSKRRKVRHPGAMPETVTNAAAPPQVMHNGFGDAVGFPFNQAVPGGFSEQVTQTTTLFKNLRYYLVSNFRQLLSQAYVEIGLVQTVVDVPVDDAFRGGITIKSQQIDEEQIRHLKIHMDRRADLETAAQALKWCRLFGGGGLLVLSDQDPEEPLDVEALSEDSELEFRAVDLWELFWDKQNTEGFSPEGDLVSTAEGFNYYGESLDNSRVVILKGITPPSFIRPRLRGWGVSVVEILVRSINQYLKATDLGFEVLDEFKLDVFKMKNLVNTLLSPNGEEKVRRRIAIANAQKNYQNALVMDSEDDFDHKQLSFSGLAEAMSGIRMQVASDLRMPLTKIFGISASGFNSGEDDIEVYNSMVENQIRVKAKYPVQRMVELRCQELFGFIPDDIEIEWQPLRVLTSEQQENVKTQKFQRALQALQAGVITSSVFMDICNKGNLFDVQLDPEELPTFTPGDDSSDEGEDTEDPGDTNADDAANAPDSKQVTTGKKAPPKMAPNAKAANIRNSLDPVTPWSKAERATRVLGNSAAFDKAAYEADRGDEWIDSRRRELFENPGNVDEGLWAKAKEASQKALGTVNWKFTVWFYKKQGGTFR